MSLREPWWRNKVNYINYGTQCLSRFSLRKKETPICQKVQIVHVWRASYAVYKSRGRTLLGNWGNPTANWPGDHSHCEHVSPFAQVKMLRWSEEESVMSLCLSFASRLTVLALMTLLMVPVESDLSNEELKSLSNPQSRTLVSHSSWSFLMILIKNRQVWEVYLRIYVLY